MGPRLDLDDAQALISAGTTAAPDVRAVYLARARIILADVRTRLAEATLLLDAGEKELVRVGVSERP